MQGRVARALFHEAFMKDRSNIQAYQKATLEEAFKYADEYVLENTSCSTLADISNGWCDVWAEAVKRRAPFVEVRQWQGHWFVEYGGVAYDSDTADQGSAVPE